MYRVKDGIYVGDDGHPVCLTKDQIVNFCRKKALRHGLDVDYCTQRMLLMNHWSIKEFIINIENTVYWAFFFDYDNLFAFRRKRESKNGKNRKNEKQD